MIMAPSFRDEQSQSTTARSARQSRPHTTAMNTASSSLSSLDDQILALSAAEKTREDKRRDLEGLHRRYVALKEEINVLENELLQLDTEIDSIEKTIHEAGAHDQQRQLLDDPPKIKKEQPLLKKKMHGNEKISEMSPTTQQPTQADEILSDPLSMVMMTQATATQRNGPPPRPYHPPSALAPSLTLRTSSSSSSSLVQPLQLTGTTKKRKSAPPPLPPPPPPRGTATLEKYFAPIVNNNRASTTGQPSDDNDNNNHHSGMSNHHYHNRKRPPLESSSSCAIMIDNNNTNILLFPWSHQVTNLLQNTFRIPSFRDHQQEIINATLQGHDVFVLMRTGGGKSLTYQLPALLEGRYATQNKITLVVSPLLSLIQDQEEQMNAFAPGSAVSFTSGLSGGNAEHARRWKMVRDPNGTDGQGPVCMILVTPEKVHKSPKLRSELQHLFDANRLGRFVIDECHCACQWGHDFRPDYAQLGILKRHFPSIPVMALTATASPMVREDVCNILGMNQGPQQCRFFRSTAHRPNLHYSVRSKKNDAAVVSDMVDFIQEKHARHAGIVYTFSRKDADTVAANLSSCGVSASAYHSDVSARDKERIHRSWMRNQTQVVVATIAFGLGINKPDVRFVLHHTISKTLEAYYQESGRAGRDGNDADCILYFSPKDVPKLRTMVHSSQSGAENLLPMIRYAQTNGNDAVCKAILMNHLGEPDAPNLTEVLRQNDGITTESREVGSHGQTVTRLLLELTQEGEEMTLSKLVKQWRAKGEGAPQCVKDNPPANDSLSEEDCERIVSYTSTAYLRLGSKGYPLIQSPAPKIIHSFPKKVKANGPGKQRATRKPAGASGDWLETKPKAKRKAATATAGGKKKAKKAPAKAKGKAKPAKKSATTKRKKCHAPAAAAAPRPSVQEVIELCSSDEDESSDEEDEIAAPKARSVAAMLDDDSSTEEENEF